MTVRTKAELKALFETGDIPNAQAFIDLIDSFLDANADNWPTTLPASSGQNLTDIAVSVDVSEWLAFAPTPGYVNASTLTFSGNWTSSLLVGRRVKLTLSAGAVYSEVLTSTYDSGTNATTLTLKDAVADNTITVLAVSIFKPAAQGGSVGMGTLGISAAAQTMLDDSTIPAMRQTLGQNASGSFFTRMHNFGATSAPGVGDDTADGYAVGSWWYDTTADQVWTCLDATAGAAVWKPAFSRLVQQVEATPYTTHTSTITTIPVDNTIPQNTEGVEILSVAITPKKTSNRLVIEAIVPFSISGGNATCTAALFQDSVADALAVGWEFKAANEPGQVLLRHEMAAGTVSATTFKLRVGPVANTLWLNGLSTGRIYGGASSARLTVREIEG